MHIQTRLGKSASGRETSRLTSRLLAENPRLDSILRHSPTLTEAMDSLRDWAREVLYENPVATRYYSGKATGQAAYKALRWQDFAAIRVLDYIAYAGVAVKDRPLNEPTIATSHPFRVLWLAVRERDGGGGPHFFEDMIHLFRQLRGRSRREMPRDRTVVQWMERHPTGLDSRVVEMRRHNRDRIINILIDKMDRGEIARSKYWFEPGMTRKEKVIQMQQWWNDHRFHLKFAVRNPDLLNELLDNSLEPDTMALLRAAHAKRVPFFVNPYYLSLVNVRPPSFAAGADLAIRSYVIYSAELIEAYGDIEAWEKEDQVRPGKPNVAGWLLPSEYNIHRRYPEVAILIPDSMGRACGGLCAACQRMYDYQRGRFAFNFDRLQPNKRWPKRLNQLMSYFATDSQLRDILITGGDALMSTEKTLGGILDAVYEMAIAKRIANEKRAEGDKFAEMVRVRLGTRLPVYLPQRITPKLVALLRAFREKARAIGIRQFVVQTHFESPMEVTPEAREAVARLTSAGWTVTNQQVFTAAASRRGHTAKLRRTLNEIGVLPYYTFSCKGYYENRALFATNARAVQEVLEEKSFGVLSEGQAESVRAIAEQPEHATKGVPELRESAALPFLATDRTVLNLPGVGKSLSFRVIGMTADGRRILAFEHDPTRAHSPVIHEPGRVLIVESKSIRAYLDQLAEMGEDVNEYASIWGHSIGETESRSMVYEYPEQRVQITDKLTHFALDSRSGRSEVSARAKVN